MPSEKRLVAYSPDLSTYHEIRATSLQSEEYFNAVGKFTLIVPPTDYNIQNISHRSILYRTDTKTSLVVERIAPDTSQNRITINGSTSNVLLNKRTFAVPTSITTVESGVYAAVAANLRGLPDVLVAEVTGLTETLPSVLYEGELLAGIIPVLNAVGLGHKMSWNTSTKKHTFTIYKGADRTSGNGAVVFSSEQGTARDLKIEDDESVFKNVCYVLGELTTGAQIIEIAGTAVAGERFEMWHDATNKKQSDDESEADYRTRLSSAGLEELAKRIRRTSFSVRVDDGRFGVAYGLGDVVACVSKRFGMKFNAVVKGVKRTLTNAGETVNVILGDSILDVIGEMKLWQK